MVFGFNHDKYIFVETQFLIWVLWLANLHFLLILPLWSYWATHNRNSSFIIIYLKLIYHSVLWRFQGFTFKWASTNSSGTFPKTRIYWKSMKWRESGDLKDFYAIFKGYYFMPVTRFSPLTIFMTNSCRFQQSICLGLRKHDPGQLQHLDFQSKMCNSGTCIQSNS